MARTQPPIFVNYRRDDASGSVNALLDRLKKEFGKKSVYADVRQFEPGDFRRSLDAQVAASEVMLVVIGPRWLTLKDDAGEVRLFKTDDFVRREIALGLRLGKEIIPVLVEGAAMPAEGSLPEDIKELAFRNAVELRHASWEADLDKFVEVLRRIVGGGRRWLKLAVASVVVLVGVFFVVKLSQAWRGDSALSPGARETPSTLNQPTPAATPPFAVQTPTPEPDGPLVGTTWEGGTVWVSVNDPGKYRVHFRDGHNVEWVTTRGEGREQRRDTKVCAYSLSGNEITIECGADNMNRDGRGELKATLKGKVDGDKMSGRGERGPVKWTWSITRVR